jgi:outer membrane biosynthesis protein TonB
MAVALALSGLAHLQVFGALSWLALVQRQQAALQRRPVEIAFEVAESGQPAAPEAAPLPDPRAEAEAGEAPLPVTRDPSPVRAPAPRPRAAPPPPPQALAERARPTAERPPEPPAPAPPVRAVPPPPANDRRQSVTQRSDDPSVPPPPDARFLAEQSRRVEEETVAELRNHQEDAPDPSAGRPLRASTERSRGNDTESESADLREAEGHTERTATRREAEERRPLDAPVTPPARVAAAGDTTPEGEPGGAEAAGRAGRAAGGSASVRGGGEASAQTVVIHDGQGALTVRVPRATAPGLGVGLTGGVSLPGFDALVRGEGRGAGAAVAGLGDRGLGDGAGAGSGPRGEGGAGGAGRGSGEAGVDLRVSWSLLEDTYTAEQLQREREAYVRERRSRARGSSRGENWEAFRAAIENYVPGVRPGNQTALNAAASPFAGYLAEVHRRIHRQFADRFLPGLPQVGELADRSLVTKLEIIFNKDGSIHRVGVVQTSGHMVYDYGAFEAVMRGQPYPEAPDAILSGDGRVYVRWAFYRNERQCGTFNAEPYILPRPPGVPGPARDGAFVDRPEEGGVIPRDARPAAEEGPTGGRGPSRAARGRRGA